jgi:hypothetical protein
MCRQADLKLHPSSCLTEHTRYYKLQFFCNKSWRGRLFEKMQRVFWNDAEGVFKKTHGEASKNHFSLTGSPIKTLTKTHSASFQKVDGVAKELQFVVYAGSYTETLDPNKILLLFLHAILLYCDDQIIRIPFPYFPITKNHQPHCVWKLRSEAIFETFLRMILPKHVQFLCHPRDFVVLNIFQIFRFLVFDIGLGSIGTSLPTNNWSKHHVWRRKYGDGIRIGHVWDQHLLAIQCRQTINNTGMAYEFNIFGFSIGLLTIQLMQTLDGNENTTCWRVAWS